MSEATILIVEDEAIIAADLAGKLGRLGYLISGTTGFGEEAVNQAREQRPDLVLMDIRLAGTMDGIEAAEIIRREIDLPVIFLTAHSDQATLDRAKLAEPFGYILKPFEERELATNIEMALYKHSTDRRLRQAHDDLELRVEERTRELKEAEQELREMNETLELRVAKRTAELESANLLLRNSRLAALNMMEDAVAARGQAEEASFELQREATERKLAEEALRESELFHRQILESIPGMVFTTRPDGYCDYQSQQWVDFTGIPMVEHLGDGWNKLLHPDDRPRAFAAWRAAVEERAPYDLEYRVRRYDGAYEWFKVRGRPIRDAAGEIVRWFGTALNIDHLIKAEEELRQAKEEWELTFNSVPDLIAILNDRHQVVRVNTAMADRLGRKPEECVGMTCYEAIHGSILPPEFCPHSRTMADGREYTVELRAERLEADYLVSTTPLFDPQGRMTGTVHVARDITERKRAEEALRKAKEAAEAATRAKSQFLANMSHELRTPMSGVIGMLDLALSGDLEAEQKEFIEVARSSADSLVRILNDILDLTKIESGKLAIEEKPFSLRRCVEDTVSLLLPSALSKGLDLNFSVDDDVPATVIGDQLRLSQVLTNLAGNSVKFTDEGWLEINVTAGSRAADGKREVTFTVADTGIGIPADKEHLLFRPFSQVDDSHTRSYGGTGLGLVISKEIVERMGGTITFSSEEGKGSTFSCTIPFAETGEASVDIGASGKTETEVDTPCAVETTRPRLLVAEDDATIRQVLGLMLKRSNFEIDFAESGVEVVEIWEKGQFDLILMDVQMPGMNGFEATAAIREKERTRGDYTPIIAMTAHALKEDEERCFAAGMDSYISKPIDFKKSLQMIKDLIKNNGT